MKVVVVGASGMIGSALVPALRQQGHAVITVGRRADHRWNSHAEDFPAAALVGADAVIHLAAESLVKRWTARQKAIIRDSRVEGTRKVAEAAAKAQVRSFLSASTAGYYGDQGENVITEDSPAGRTFIAQVTQNLEAACLPAAAAGVRVVLLRMSIILSAKHGVMAGMLRFFHTGFGGSAGNGRQFVGWISLRDTVRAILYMLTNEQVSGPVNLNSPHPARMADWAAAVGRILRRPALIHWPRLILRAVYGEVVDNLIFTSQKISPSKLNAAGFQFLDPDLEPALRAAIADPD